MADLNLFNEPVLLLLLDCWCWIALVAAVADDDELSEGVENADINENFSPIFFPIFIGPHFLSVSVVPAGLLWSNIVDTLSRSSSGRA